MLSALMIWTLSGCAYITDKEYRARLGSGGGGSGTESCEDPLVFYADADGDGYGDPAVEIEACEPVEGAVDNALDCDDADGAIALAQTLWLDSDFDGYGDPETEFESCFMPDGSTGNALDCDDTNPDINPDAQEDCATDADDDCSGETNQPDALGCVESFADADGDGFGGMESSCLCEATESFPAVDNADCDDADASVNPDAEEICNDGVDNNCDDQAVGCGLASALDPSGSDLRVAGSAPSDGMGATLHLGGDVTGDGDADVLIAAYKGSRLAVLSGPVLDAESIAYVTGPAGDWYGRALATGDLNGDGQADLVVGAPQASFSGRIRAGRVAIHYGPLGADATLDDGDAIVGGSVANAYSGRNIAMGPDMTGDGAADVLIGAIDAKSGGLKVGMVAIVSGAPESSPVDLSSSDGVAVRIFGASGGDKFGVAMVAGADLNGDGLPDPIISARSAGANTGMVYAFASGTDLSGDFTASDADWTMTGVGAGARTGEFMAAAGDITGDGTDDLLVGASQRNLSGTRRGAAYLIAEFATGDINEVAQLEMQSKTNQEHFGLALSSAGDLDGYGATIAVGAPNAGSGSVYLFAAGSGIVTTDEAIAHVMGEVAGDRLGSAVLGGFDYDGDGLGDLLIGAEDAADGAGEGMIFLGGGL